MKWTALWTVALLNVLAGSNVAHGDTDPTRDAGSAAPDPTPAPPDAPPSDAPSPPTTTPAEQPPAGDATPADDNDNDDGKKKKKKKKKKKHHGEDDDLSADQGDLDSSPDKGHSFSDVAFRFLIQTRYTASLLDHDIDPATTLDPRLHDGWSMNRVFVRATSQPTDWLGVKVLVDMAEFSHRQPKRALKLAYGEIEVNDHVKFVVGLFKRTYSLTELLPIADFEFADTGPTDTLIKDAELGGRDPGAMIEVAPLRKRKWLKMYLAAFDGGLNGPDTRPWGLVTGRIVGQPIKHVKIGLDGVYRSHGQTVPAGVLATTTKGKAVSADLIVDPKPVMFRIEWLWGDRTDQTFAGDPATSGARTWMAAWGIAAVKIPVSTFVLMPAARVEWLDADREHPIGGRYLFSAALTGMDPHERLRVMLDLSRSQVTNGTFPLSAGPVLLDVSATVIVAQVQLKI